MKLKVRSMLRHAAFAAAAMILLCAVLGSAGCAKKNKEFVVPDGMTREEAALFTAVAKVCPKDDNHSKAELLTFYIEGWSFDAIPQQILEYLGAYCSSGGAAMMQFDFDTLKTMGYIAPGNGDFFGEDELVYNEGTGKIFTFTLKEGEDVNSDHVAVSVKGFISDKDTSGYDVELTYTDGAWRFERFSNVWNQYDFFTPEPESPDGPEK